MIQARTRQQTEAIVLRLLDYGESDRIVTFSTADFGKIRGIAKGARRSRKRFTNALEPFCHSRMMFSRKSPDSLALIEECDVLCHFPSIRADLEKTLVASCLIELTDHFTPGAKERPLCAAPRISSGCSKGLSSRMPCCVSSNPFAEISGFDQFLDRCLLKSRSETEQPTISTSQKAA